MNKNLICAITALSLCNASTQASSIRQSCASAAKSGAKCLGCPRKNSIQVRVIPPRDTPTNLALYDREKPYIIETVQSTLNAGPCIKNLNTRDLEYNLHKIDEKFDQAYPDQIPTGPHISLDEKIKFTYLSNKGRIYSAELRRREQE